MKDEIPESLKEFLPLLAAMELELSTHYHPPNKPEAKWALVNRRGEAGRVGMTEEQARKDIIQSAAALLDRYRLSLLAYADKTEGELDQLLKHLKLRAVTTNQAKDAGVRG